MIPRSRTLAPITARSPRPPRLGAVVGAATLAAGLIGPGPAPAQSGASALTPPSCETYQRERPRGGEFEQLSALFGLSIYRWGEADYARYRDFLIACKRSQPEFRPEVSARDWEAAVGANVAKLQQHTGYLSRLGEVAGNPRGSRPGSGEPDDTLAFDALGCDRFTRSTVNAWARGGPPDASPDAPFGVPLAAWRPEVWRAFENRVLACVQLPGGEAQTERDWLHTLVYGQEVNAAAAIRQARQDVGAARTELAGILARASEAEGLSSADEIAGKLAALDALIAAGPKLAPTEAAQAAAARERITARLRNVRAADAEAWERDRPAREARARQQEAELADLQRRNSEREADATAERERAAKLEAERQTTARLQAEQQAKETAAQQQREDQARLASDPCNKTEARRALMAAANTVTRAQYGGRTLVDLTDGRSLDAGAAPGRSCLFVADWSSGERGLVTITLRKNSFGDDLIEVR